MSSETVARQGAAAPWRARVGELIFVGAILAFSALGVLLSGAIREPVGSSNVLGARVLPYVVTAFMCLTALAAFIATLRGRVGTPEEGEDVDESVGTSWRTVALLVIAFASLMVVIPIAGWPVAVTVLFTGSALALGAKSWWRALLIGAGLGVLTQVLFGILLGLSLPAFGEYLPEVFRG
ncbi:MAG TPA: tripartite tricarboxylate transporter TctB family protein [Candidatus Microbacterium pullistercoris]|nr:tripartite tricarboxylate transporter TctB family protein [Candidatus Microbacterium pullistercoris]